MNRTGGDLFSPALEGLNPTQRLAAGQAGGPVLVVAGAGSGKTRTLVHRVAYLVERGVEPGRILLLTFTRKAAQEMLTRARDLNPQCARVEGGTFHSLCYRLLRAHASRLGLSRQFTVIDRGDCEQLIRGVMQERGLKAKGDRQFPKARTINDIISKSRNLEASLEDAIEQWAGHLLGYLEEISQAARGFAEAKRSQSLVDYDDLLFLAEELLRDHHDLRQRFSRHWQHLLVDEYQDTNAVQARLLKLLASEHDNLMVVGDDAQSIYRFRGARVQNIFEFPQDYPGAKVIKLEQNYRSTQAILDLSNEVIAQAWHRYDKKLFTERLGGSRPVLRRPRDDRGQAGLVNERIAQLIKSGSRPEDIAVLFRASRDSYELELELTASRVPFVKVGGFRFLEASHIKDALSHLRVIANPSDFLSWQRLLMLLPGVGPKKAQAAIRHLVEAEAPELYLGRLASAPGLAGPAHSRLVELMSELSDPAATPITLVEAVIDYYEPICREAHEDYPRRLRDLEELPGLARGFSSLSEFMADVVLEPPGAYAAEAQGGRITLSTVHSAKGLEWPQVFILWATDGRLPPQMALMDPESLEEERRLMYVACTRAAGELTILAPRESYQRGRGVVNNELSRFLADLPPGLLEKPREAIFEVPQTEASPQSRGSQRQDRPFAVGGMVRHNTFGKGRVMGYQGGKKILVHFERHGLKILLLEFANLSEA
ncbi:MAG: ATP-dependent helicase [Proteobacteria bacterium]|nr:ATP-dependent helicase [Pseudomonadota bacterium]MBU1453065.1 ATP-dependent helicase [Pseudomonadota bacterium]MBU2467142.1 ATP-dependent helicase [Pseudomonadota bacterium]MBU2518882.1 ATP-dependent helicase [Pseudomonadota bacterium]